VRILQIKAPGQAGLIEVDDPRAGPGEVIVRVEATASCPHWDITMLAGRDIFDRPGFPRYPALPGQPGHEMTGIVESVGPGVSEFLPGDAVVVWRTMGEEKPGYYAEKACVPVADLLPRPAHLSAADTAGLEMGMCVAACLLTLPALSGKCFSVAGLGPAGLIAVQMAKAAGAERITGFDPLAERRELACQLGADEAHDPLRETSADFVAAHGKADYAMDCSGNAASVQYQMDIVARGISLFGVQHESYIYYPRHWLGGLTLYGPGGHGRAAAEYALRQIASGALRLAPLNSVELPLSRFVEGTTLLTERRALKVLYRPD